MVVRELLEKILPQGKKDAPFLLEREVLLLKRNLRELKGLEAAILFGSRARGDFDADSDYDLLLVFDKVNSNVKESVDNLSVRLLLLSPPIVIGPLIKAKGDRISEPLAREILRDGIVLFGRKAAH